MDAMNSVRLSSYPPPKVSVNHQQIEQRGSIISLSVIMQKLIHPQNQN